MNTLFSLPPVLRRTWVPVDASMHASPVIAPKPVAVTARAGAAGNPVAQTAAELRTRLVAKYAEAFDPGTPIHLEKAPARVNFLGEHVDNYGGPNRQTTSVPFAIDRYVLTASQATKDDKVELESLKLGEISFDLKTLTKEDVENDRSWARYPKAIAFALREKGYSVSGLRGVLDTTISGNGLSSSAALNLSLANSFAKASGLNLEAQELVEIARRSEHLTGTNCGYMDQMASALSEAGKALFVTFGKEKPGFEPVSLDLGDNVIVVVDSGKDRELKTSQYNVRVKECQQALSLFKVLLEKDGRTLHGLGEITPDEFRRFGNVAELKKAYARLPESERAALSPSSFETLLRRVRHVVSEGERVEVLKGLMQDDSLTGEQKAEKAGALLSATHASLRDDFGVSCAELDALTEIAREHGALGARLMGAGEGGNMIFLAPAREAEAMAKAVTRDYAKRFPERKSSSFIARPSAGLESFGAPARKVAKENRIPLADSERRFLATKGFDEGAFMRQQKRVRDGELTPASSIFQGKLEAPRAEDIDALAALSPAEATRLKQMGEDALRRGEVGVVVLAGGMATRFGGAVKAAVDVLPGRSFIQMKLEDARAKGETYGKAIPFCVMSSFATTHGIKEHLEARGLNGPDIHMFEQGVSVRMTPEGGLFRDRAGHVSYNAPGHGDFYRAFRESGTLQKLRDQGVKYVFFSNVDNVAATVDPRIIGYHIDKGVSMTAEVVAREPGSPPAGAPVRADGGLRILESACFPEGMKEEVAARSAINSFGFTLDALDQDIALQQHMVLKEVDGQTAVQLESFANEASAVKSAQGEPLLSMACIEVPGGTGSKDSRFLPVKKPSELEEVAAFLQSL